MKKPFSHSTKFILLVFMGLLFIQARAQEFSSPKAIIDCQYTIENDVQVSPYELQFDLYLKDTDPSQPFNLSLIQGGFFVSTSIIGGGTVICDVVPGFSDLLEKQHPDTATYGAFDATRFILKMACRRMPRCDSTTIISTTDMGTRVVRLKIVNTVPFPANSQADITFCHTTSPPPYYAARVYQYDNTYPPCVSTEVPLTDVNSFQGSTYKNLHMNTGTGTGNLSSSPVIIFTKDKTVSIKCADGFHNTLLTITNLVGQTILTQKLVDQKSNEIRVDAVKGYYIVKVRDDAAIKISKVFID